MANTFLKPTVIINTALGLLQREIVLPNLVWSNAVPDFAGVQGDTVTLRLPARLKANRRTLRSGTAIVMDALAEIGVDVKLTDDVYSAVPITDEELTLDIVSFADQVLQPQVRAVAEGLEDMVADSMAAAPWTAANTVSIAASGGTYEALVDARTFLNKNNVPLADRVFLLGADREGAFLKSDQLKKFDNSGDSSALRDARIGQIAGMPGYTSNAIDPAIGYVFHKTAFVLATRPPVVPDGAPFGQRAAYAGLAMRWLRDYDFTLTRDRSLVDAFAGTNFVADGGTTNEIQTVTITGAPTGGSFTLTQDGNTTAAIAYNASAAAVRNALNQLPDVDVTVTGPASGVYTVTFTKKANVSQMTATGSFTGGTSPAVAVATSTAGDATATMVRAVKIVA